MTIFLTKTIDEKTHHYRVTVEHSGVDIVQGIFYQWLGKSYQGCEDRDKALAKQKELIEEKLKEGYIITDFTEKPENTLQVYDKAKWHYGGNFPAELDNFQGYVHTGMFLGWLIDQDLVSDDFKTDFAEEIQRFKDRELTGTQIYEACDGVLSIEELNETGNHFALAYFDFDNGKYLVDYENTLARGLASLYHVKDTWENYNRLKEIVDYRFSDWEKKKSF